MLNKAHSFLKKATAVSMSAIMLSGLAFSVGAKAYDDIQAEYVYRDQIDLLSDIGVIKGTSENEFSPQDKVSREQMALLLYRLMMAGRNNAGTVNGTAFTDLYDPTYHGAITWANSNGYIFGTSASTFEPREGIMFQDALTMVVRALGHSTKAMENGYPWTFIDEGIKLGLDNGLEKVRYTQELTRGEVAALLYNALSSDYLITHNGSTVLEKSTIIEKIFGYSIKEARIVATNDYTVGDNTTIIKNGYVTLESAPGLQAIPHDAYVEYLRQEKADWLRLWQA